PRSLFPVASCLSLSLTGIAAGQVSFMFGLRRTGAVDERTALPPVQDRVAVGGRPNRSADRVLRVPELSKAVRQAPRQGVDVPVAAPDQPGALRRPVRRVAHRP